MSTPPASPASHTFQVIPRNKGERGAFLVADFFMLPIASESSVPCPICGASVPVPSGVTVRQHIEACLQELGGEDAYITYMVRHRGQRPDTPLSQTITASEAEDKWRKRNGQHP